MAKNKSSVSAFIPDTDNEMFQLAIQLVNQSNRNIFLTGKAGTGKTTFLKWIRNHCAKQMAVLAPTGVAAMNAGGVTIHSFFQLPLAPFIPESNNPGPDPNNNTTNKHSLLKGLRYNNEKRRLLQELELLVIDEISMVRCDILDAVDVILRHFRHRYFEKFGGVQVLFIGDMLQLPPVVKEQEWNILSPYYKGLFFFNSKVLEDDPPLFIEFTKIYRQNEESFLRLLNQVRDNELDDEGRQILESRYQPGFMPTDEERFIILTTHNNRAAEINSAKLNAIDQPLYSFEAEIKNEFPDRSYPAEQSLRLKVGAQVMFIRNDSSERGKRYFNGKIGIVSRVEDDKIFVQCETSPGNEADPEEIEIQKEKWDNIRYKLDKSTGHLDSETLGSFTQFPLRLAWAITIHKSQGLSFEKAIIDAGEAFAAGQVYVALSRCTNLKGLVLKSRIKNTGLFSDPAIIAFSKKNHSAGSLQAELDNSRTEYLKSIILSTFEFLPLVKLINELKDYALKHKSGFNEPSIPWINDIEMRLNKLKETSGKFATELNNLFGQEEFFDNSPLHQRVIAASAYFSNESKPLISLFHACPSVTDSWAHAKEVNELSRQLYEQLSRKIFLMDSLAQTLDIVKFQQRKLEFINPPLRLNTYAGVSQVNIASEHPLLHQKLRKLRDTICSEKNLPLYMVAGSKTIEEMARFLPQDQQELRKISGFGEVKTGQFGEAFLELIRDYSSEHQLTSLIHEKTTKKEKGKKQASTPLKKDTRAESFRIFKTGMSIIEISKERKLTVQTIEGHLTRYIETGEINIDELLSREKLKLIGGAIKDWNNISLTEIKNKLGDDISYGEIKYTLAWFETNAIDSIA